MVLSDFKISSLGCNYWEVKLEISRVSIFPIEMHGLVCAVYFREGAKMC
jgi:hypothetical protein